MNNLPVIYNPIHISHRFFFDICDLFLIVLNRKKELKMMIKDLTYRTTETERATNRYKGTEEHNNSDTTLVDVVSILVQ